MITCHIGLLCACVCARHAQTEPDLILSEQSPRLMSDLPYGVIDEELSDELMTR